MDIAQALENASMELVELKTRLPGQDAPAYYRPMTLAQSDAINREIVAAKAESDGAKLAITLMHTVLDSAGNRLFKTEHRNKLMNQVPQAILVSMVEEITGQAAGADAVEDAEGN